MKLLQYEDLLSGDAIYIKDIGHFRSPFLRELKPTSGIGIWTYHFYLDLLLWDKDEYIRFLKLLGIRKTELLEQNIKLETFDVATLMSPTCKLLCEAMAFFLTENLVWEEKMHRFCCVDKVSGKQIGYIDRKNFEEVREIMLQMNYVKTLPKKVKHSSKRSQTLWEQAQKYLNNSKSQEDKNATIGNVISKLCAVSNSYNLLNVYDLTVYQLYDQYFQCSYLKVTDLNERIFSQHGGKDFKMGMWQEPIVKL